MVFLLFLSALLPQSSEPPLSFCLLLQAFAAWRVDSLSQLRDTMLATGTARLQVVLCRSKTAKAVFDSLTNNKTALCWPKSKILLLLIEVSQTLTINKLSHVHCQLLTEPLQSVFSFRDEVRHLDFQTMPNFLSSEKSQPNKDNWMTFVLKQAYQGVYYPPRRLAKHLPKKTLFFSRWNTTKMNDVLILQEWK